MKEHSPSSSGQILRRLKSINRWHLLWVIVLSEIVTAVMNALMGTLWWGEISYDLIMIGTIDALVAAIVVGTIVLYIIERLRETDKNYRELVEIANSIILRMDGAGNIIFFNEFAEKFFGFSKEHVIGRSVIGTILPEKESTGRDLAFMIQDICRNTEKYIAIVNENMLSSGELVWISWTNKPVFDQKGNICEVLCIGSDVTEMRKKDEKLQEHGRQLEKLVAERTAELTEMVKNMQHEIAKRETTELAFRESEERFHEIFEQNENALLILEHSTGEIMDVNPAALDMFGYSRQELISEGLPLILMTGEHEHFRNEMRGRDTSGRFHIAQITCRKKDGTSIITSLWGKAVQLKKSEVLFCSFKNITEKLRREEETKLLQAKLIQMNKMTSLGMLVSGIAHEINNPNHFIMVNAMMVSDAWKDAANVLSAHYHEHGDFPLGGVPFSEMRYIIPQLLTAMSEGSDRIKNIVEDLKDFSKQGRAILDQAVDVNRVIAASAALLNSQIGKFTDYFQLSEGVDLPPVKGNKQQLEQVVINLIMNALQSLRDRSAGVIVSSCLEKETDSILIQVHDEGIGISQEVLDHITEPFYTTRSDEGGTGLGLSISFSIIKDHQGTLTFLSEPGKGTTATISLPVYQSTTERNRHATDHIS
jgi:PAS domain S-box-containing protein